MIRSLIIVLLIITSLNVCFSQSATDVNKAHTAVRSYLLKKLNNPGSYKPAKWEKLSKTYTVFDDSRDAKIIDDSLEYYKNAHDEVQSKIHKITLNNILNYRKDSTYLYYKDFSRQIDSAENHLTAVRLSKEKLFKPKFEGYVIDHAFRARNSFNALVMHNWYFILDKSFRITAAGDNVELENERIELQRKLDELSSGH